MDGSSSNNFSSICLKLVNDIEYCCSGIRGKYSGGINKEGRPHGHGSFVRNNAGMHLTYIGEWKDGERVGKLHKRSTSGKYHLGLRKLFFRLHLLWQQPQSGWKNSSSHSLIEFSD